MRAREHVIYYNIGTQETNQTSDNECIAHPVIFIQASAWNRYELFETPNGENIILLYRSNTGAGAYGIGCIIIA